MSVLIMAGIGVFAFGLVGWFDSLGFENPVPYALACLLGIAMVAGGVTT